jgi:hypothetical protein
MDWVSANERLPDIEGEYLVAFRVHGGWQYMLDELCGGDDETPSVWMSDGPTAPKVEMWLDFPRVGE